MLQCGVMMKMRMTDKEDDEACACHTQPRDWDEVMIPDRTRAGISLPVRATSWAERRVEEEVTDCRYGWMESKGGSKIEKNI